MQALLELDCIPAGMELFQAADEDQWTLIKEVIDISDYYIVIVGAKYGSITSEGISYTEKEFDYAASSDIPIFGYLHSNPGSIPQDLVELDEAVRKQLDAFRDKVRQRPVGFYSTAVDLGSKVSRAIARARTRNPRPGGYEGQKR